MVVIKGHILCPFLQDVILVLGVPRMCLWSFSPKYPTDNLLQQLENAIFGVCLKKSWFGAYRFKCKWAAYSHPVSRGGRCVYVSLHCIATAKNSREKQHNWEWENQCLAVHMRSQMRWKWDETARCYRACAELTCHRRGSIDRAAWPNESRATNGTNLSHKCGADQLKYLMYAHKYGFNAKHYNDMTFTKESGVVHVFR